MQKKRRISGFTMAELLIVVAVITVLSGVGFVAVQRHQRSLAQLDRDSVAKEIFIAAQNHLSMAESQGFLGATEFGTEVVEGGKHYYYVVNNGTPAAGSVVDVMLPFGSIDDTVRSGGSYMIIYQQSPAAVLDVFYCTRTGKPESYNHPISEEDYSTFLGYRSTRPTDGYVVGYYGGEDALEASQFTIQAPTIEVKNAERLTVEVTDVNENASLKLIIASTSLDVNGAPTAQAAIELAFPNTAPSARVTAETSGHYSIVLDDITTEGLRFNSLNEIESSTDSWFDRAGTFVPGEDIVVQAVAFNNDALSNIAYSSAITTNSLFAYVEKPDSTPSGLDVDSDDADAGNTSSTGKTAMISNIRHLENLDNRVSGIDADAIGLTGAKQTADLVWAEASATDASTAFTYRIAEAKSTNGPRVTADSIRVFYKAGNSYTNTDSGCYLPVNLDYALVYDAAGVVDGVMKCHSITGVQVGSTTMPYAGAAGLFGDVSAATTIQNLELIDFSINSTGSAGALAGTVTGTASAKAKIENVLAHNSTADATATITSTAGSAGGLIGEMTYCDVNKCAAALVVSGYTNAGGLVGASSGGSVLASYSGGHCVEKKVTDSLIGVGYDSAADKSNVTATAEDGDAYAGGLIGNAGGTHIESCYSTCSVKGKTAGGLIGSGSGVIKNNYAAGLVSGTNIGAFAGDLTGATGVTGCQYFEIINETVGATGASYLPPVPGKVAADETTGTQQPGVTRIDASVESYETFVGTPANWSAASAYLGKGTDAATDDWLDIYYSVGGASKYNLKGIPRMTLSDGVTINASADTDTPADFVATHYGDWPAPEVFVINTPSNDSGAIDPTIPSP